MLTSTFLLVALVVASLVPFTSAEVDEDGEEILVTTFQICPANRFMNDRLRGLAKEAHNYRRGRLARGLVFNKRGKYLPMAANMRQLVYNCTLEEMADRFARSCQRGPDRNLTAGVQQNYFFIPKSRAIYRVDALRQGIMFWWSRLRETGGIGQNVTFRTGNVGKPIARFTRMAWATTMSLGCGVAKCPNDYSVVCNYAPGGNIVNQQIYMKGEPCSQCPPNTFCTTDKLCAPISTVG
ncbi:hypothetical protein V3C99_014349 [Haemonchus contortus]|uniref:SCP domain-containing protein n=1 Tax=Haemonchus contortus TaxID=6289 RepID=A0A7I4YU10_HAECO